MYICSLKIEHLVTCLKTMACVYAAFVVCVTIFSTGYKFRPVSNFNTLTQPPVLILMHFSTLHVWQMLSSLFTHDLA